MHFLQTFDAGDYFMIQQIQSDEDDDNDVIDDENVDGIIDADAEGQSSVETRGTAVESAAEEWSVVSIKPGGAKAADPNQYVSH